jgi:hypothetical protein
MDDSTARTAKKRLLEQEDGPSDHLTEHHGLDTAGGATRHPLPSSPDSRDSPTLSQGKLPPLQMRTSSASAESITFSPLLLPLPSALKESFPYQLNISRPRPLSLSENSQQQLKRQRLDSGTGEDNSLNSIHSLSFATLPVMLPCWSSFVGLPYLLFSSHRHDNYSCAFMTDLGPSPA